MSKALPKALASPLIHGNPASMFYRLVALAVLSVYSAIAADETLFRDDFKDGLAPGWTWIREDKSAWRTTGHGLEIRIQPGNQWGGENSAKNVLVRDLPKTGSPIEITVTVENRPTEQYEQVDLVAYYDDSHQVKIGEELVDGKLSIVMGREEKDRTRTLAIIPLAKTRVELKLRLDGPNITGFFRPDGATDWTKAGECDLPGEGLPRITLQCYQGPKDKEHWAKIQNFQISRAPK
jgi:regulation of enolase protein 1 (concanavalin A-like superfamily)